VIFGVRTFQSFGARLRIFDLKKQGLLLWVWISLLETLKVKWRTGGHTIGTKQDSWPTSGIGMTFSSTCVARLARTCTAVKRNNSCDSCRHNLNSGDSSHE
jgi:hypothetical protein